MVSLAVSLSLFYIQTGRFQATADKEKEEERAQDGEKESERRSYRKKNTERVVVS